MLAALARVDAQGADADLLRELQRAVNGRWQAVMPPQSLPGFARAPLRLRGISGEPAGTLHLDAGSVYWIEPDGTPWRGVLPDGAAPLLRERLAR